MRNISFFLLLFAFLKAPAQNVTSDCSGAIHLCSKNFITIGSLPSAGANSNEVENSTVCYPEKPFLETNSVWFRWQIDNPGALSFSIIPQNEQDDLDFILYKSVNTNTLCEGLEVIRCMRAGPSLGDTTASNQSCTGVTGLSFISNDQQRSVGCKVISTNFLSPVEAQSGEIYTLFVNNYRSTGGLALGFDGNATFKPNFGNCTSVLSETFESSGSQKITLTNVFPNPATNKVNLDIKSNSDVEATIQVISTDGILLNSQSFSLPNGSSVYSVPVETLNSGVYFLKVRTENYVEIVRFFKQ